MFREAYAMLTAEEQAALDEVLAGLAASPARAHFCVNLQLEHFLPVELGVEVLRRLARSKGVAPDMLAFGDILSGMWLQGDFVRGVEPTRVGRVVVRAEFVNLLRANDSVKRLYRTDRALDDMLEEAFRLGGSDRFHQLTRLVPELNMSRHAAWITWNRDNHNGDPFGWRRTNVPEEVRCHLGLPWTVRNERLLLLTYDLPPGCELFRPTICDAHIEWPFEPPPKNFLEHGLTKQLAQSAWPQEVWELPEECHPRRQPEALHRALPLLYLKMAGPDSALPLP